MSPRRKSDKLMPVAEARERLLAHLPVSTEHRALALREALGHTLAQPAQAAMPVPPFDHSAMDGYAVRSNDLAAGPTTLAVAERITAGQAPAPLAAGNAARIMTGAVIPEGADTVVMQERCEVDEAGVRILAAAEPGANIRRAGEEFEPGQRVLDAGCRLQPQHIGLLASIGIAEVRVRPPLRVAVLSTGDELVKPGRALAPGQIYNSNTPMLEALVRRLGGVPQVFDRVPDTAEATGAALRRAVAEANLVLTSGGVSVGDTDWVRKTIEQLGRLELWKIAVKPGKPLAFGAIDQVPVIGLPGNPVASFVGFCLFVAPAMRRMQGIEPVLPEPIRLPAAFEAREDSREVYWRVRRGDQGLETYAMQGSAALSSVAWAEGLARVPAGQALTPGQPVDFLSLPALLD